MTHADLRLRLAAYADGTLGDAEAEVVRAHLATGCAQCLREVFTRPVGMPRTSVVVRRTSRAVVIAAVGSAAAIGLGLGALLGLAGRERAQRDDGGVTRLAGELDRMRADRERADARARERIDRLEARVRDAEAREAARPAAPAPPAAPAEAAADPDAVPRWLEELASSGGARMVPLAAGDAAPGASGYAIWSPARGVVVVSASSLPAGGRAAVYRARVTMSDGSTVWVGDLAASERGSLVVTVALPEADGRRVASIDLYRDPPGSPALTARLRP